LRGDDPVARRMIPSPIYWTATGYDLVIRALYGRSYTRLYSDVAALIPVGASVTDVCCGTARLYRDCLRARGCRYVGLDYNAALVRAARRSGADARVFDLRRDQPPHADFVVMCSSLYHFFDSRNEVLATLLAAANEAVIISEPVRNLTSHPILPIRKVAAWLTNPGRGSYDARFDPQTFRDFARDNGATHWFHESSNRQAIAVFRAR
jgi:SAM-dependent methyltransferase